jgi:hypothetical protein
MENTSLLLELIYVGCTIYPGKIPAEKQTNDKIFLLLFLNYYVCVCRIVDE